ncbi:hypothetical protein QR685DRAFT_238562 [Neurospora intermedia]|uniref:Uncharacterized protein n=1 Tax=Neurospora intermedia TaxID=5142 RepID=A0ABR3DIN2_NEUIN
MMEILKNERHQLAGEVPDWEPERKSSRQIEVLDQNHAIPASSRGKVDVANKEVTCPPLPRTACAYFDRSACSTRHRRLPSGCPLAVWLVESTRAAAAKPMRNTQNPAIVSIIPLSLQYLLICCLSLHVEASSFSRKRQNNPPFLSVNANCCPAATIFSITYLYLPDVYGRSSSVALQSVSTL